MVTETFSPELEKEEEIVAELQGLGIWYLSRLNNISRRKDYSSAQLIADIIKQPSARVRNAAISLFLAKPEYSAYVQDALKDTNETERFTLKFLAHL